MLVIAHRGANKEALENSREAFSKAIDAGCDRIEFDVHLTPGGDMVVIHDEDLSRTTDSKLSVAELTDRSIISQIRISNGEPLACLDEILNEFGRRVELNIEIKSNSAAAGLRTLECIMDCKGEDLKPIIISSFHINPLRALVKNVLPSFIKTACLWGPEIQFPNFSSLAPPVFMRDTNSHILHPETTITDRNLVEYAKSKGWKCYPYCTMKGEDTDRERLWKKLSDLGVDGLCTNYPRELRQWIGET